MRIPRHLAIIMDGNGRWARRRHLPRIAGHQKGVETVRKVVAECRNLGIRYLTLYAFSSENWGRPSDEVHALMDLLGRYLQTQFETMLSHSIRLKVIGQVERLPPEVRKVLDDTVARTANNQDMTLTLALSYGSRDEILGAARTLVAEAAAGRLDPGAIDEAKFSACLETAGIPDPDLLIRTSGEMRISNFLLWQIAYAELVFSDVLWPDFGVKELYRSLDEFTRRQRRFGLTGEQIEEPGDEEDRH